MKDVVVWTQPACGGCFGVKRTFDRMGVDYEEADLTAPEHADKIEEFRKAGFMEAPVVTIGGTPRFAGFRPDKIEEIFS